ncbi:hypothetical protein [Pelagibius sp.]|uniref:hypothetical protein n=1 Tax=Pelagibius sp. TaxID=1931238 RepID=UPI002624D8F5|nr:hypothetical protein [Pelagibius sp.]
MSANAAAARIGCALAGGLLAVLLALALPSMAFAQSTQQRADALGAGDLRAAIAELRGLAAFYGEIAERDRNSFASEQWTGLQGNYLGIADQLAGLLGRGALRVVDLPEGSAWKTAEDRVELDKNLDGAWLPNLIRSARTRAQNETLQSDLLLPLLIQALSQINNQQDWPWFDEHLRRSGTLGPLAGSAPSRPELARYFFLKDSYLSFSMRRIAEGDPGRRHDWARRQMRTFTEVRALRQGFAERVGAVPAETLRSDWSSYVALVDGFAVTRGWLMLDPSLRVSQLRRRQQPNSVEQAANRLLAARTPPAVQPAAPATSAAGPTLAALVEQAAAFEAQRALQSSVTNQLPLQALLLQPDLGPGPSETAEFRAFAARVKEALEQPDPRAELAKRDRALSAAEEQVAALSARVSELEPVEREVAALQERVEALDEAEREVAILRAQVSELDDAQARVAELQAQVSELDEAQARVAALQAQVVELDAAQEQVTALQAQVFELDAAQEQVAALQAQVSELDAAQDQVAALQAQVVELDAAQDQVAALQAQVSELDAAQEQVAALQAQVSELDAAQDQVAALQAQVVELDAAQEQVAALQAQVGEFDAAQQRVTELQAQVSELDVARARVAELQTQVSELEEAQQQVAALQAQVSELDAARARVAELQDQVSELDQAQQQVAALQAQVSALDAAEEQVATLQAQVSELGDAQDQVAELQAQVDQLGGALDAREAETRVLETQLAEARSDPVSSIAPAVSRIEERQLYMMSAIGLMFLLTLILWAWRRERQVVVYEQPAGPPRVAPPPLLLNPPLPGPGAEEGQTSESPVIDVEAKNGADQGAEEPDTAKSDSAAARNGAATTPGEWSEAAASNGRLGEGGEEPSLEQTAAAVQAAALGNEESTAAHPIVKALRKGNLPLFELLFSELTDLRSPQLQRVVYGGGGEDLAIACRAVGVDKLLFGAIFLLTDHLRGGDADGDPDRIAAILSMYDRTAPETARRVLVKWQRDWGTELPASSSLVD